MDEKTVLSADTLILAVSFGTSYHETRQATIGAIEDALREAVSYTHLDVYKRQP